jgi:predicted nuclease of predicted toxin-antitoxin system
VDRRHAAPAFGSIAAGAFITDWIAATATDHEVLTPARQLRRVLVTEDDDFGSLIYRDGLPPPPGIVLVMTQRIPKGERMLRLTSLAKSALAVAEGHFVVAGPIRCRFRPLPHIRSS